MIKWQKVYSEQIFMQDGQYHGMYVEISFTNWFMYFCNISKNLISYLNTFLNVRLLYSIRHKFDFWSSIFLSTASYLVLSYSNNTVQQLLYLIHCNTITTESICSSLSLFHFKPSQESRYPKVISSSYLCLWMDTYRTKERRKEGRGMGQGTTFTLLTTVGWQ